GRRRELAQALARAVAALRCPALRRRAHAPGRALAHSRGSASRAVGPDVLQGAGRLGALRLDRPLGDPGGVAALSRLDDARARVPRYRGPADERGRQQALRRHDCRHRQDAAPLRWRLSRGPERSRSRRGIAAGARGAGGAYRVTTGSLRGRNESRPRGGLLRGGVAGAIGVYQGLLAGSAAAGLAVLHAEDPVVTLRVDVPEDVAV